MTPNEELDREKSLAILARELCKTCANEEKPWNHADCLGCTPEHPRRIAIIKPRATKIAIVTIIIFIILAVYLAIAARCVAEPASAEPIVYRETVFYYMDPYFFVSREMYRGKLFVNIDRVNWRIVKCWVRTEYTDGRIIVTAGE
jgi:hypothetical protein